MKFIFICDQTNIGATPYSDLFVITPYKTIYLYPWLWQSTQGYSYCCPMIITWIILVYAPNSLEHRTSDCVHIIRDLKSLHMFLFIECQIHSSLVQTSTWKKNTFLTFSYWTTSIFILCTFNLNLLCVSIYLHRSWH